MASRWTSAEAGGGRLRDTAASLLRACSKARLRGIEPHHRARLSRTSPARRPARLRSLAASDRPRSAHLRQHRQRLSDAAYGRAPAASAVAGRRQSLAGGRTFVRARHARSASAGTPARRLACPRLLWVACVHRPADLRQCLRTGQTRPRGRGRRRYAGAPARARRGDPHAGGSGLPVPRPDGHSRHCRTTCGSARGEGRTRPLAARQLQA